MEKAMRPIVDVAADIGLTENDLDLYGAYKAKIHLDAVDRSEPRGKYVVVTSISPTPAGEGKTTVSVGLAQAFWQIGRRSVVALRQSSLGPSFGIKGGATGGGGSTLEPILDLNLHLTGDFHAVTSAHNACSAFLDNHLHQGNALDLDIDAISWPRVIDMNDRALRIIETGLGKVNGPSHRARFEITAASEVMSILSLATDYADLRGRLGGIVVGYSTAGEPVTADDLKIGGAMAALMKDALSPNLVQTQEGTPAILHSGPFGNVGLGNSSVIADLMALPRADVVVTEAGFGTDLGFEKFCNVKCRTSGLEPDVAVVVVTLRSLKAHSGRYEVKAGKPLDPALNDPNPEALLEGLPNLQKHIEHVTTFGIPAIVAINSYPTDTAEEVEMVREGAIAAGATDAVAADVFARGGAGGVDLARAVDAAMSQPSQFHYLYDLDQPLRTKIERIATTMYGAERVNYEPKASEALDRFEATGFHDLPICMAKTQYSLSGDPKLLARPTGFDLDIRDVRLYAGAGYVVPIAGNIMLMPGLGRTPSGEQIDLLPDGTIVGLS